MNENNNDLRKFFEKPKVVGANGQEYTNKEFLEALKRRKKELELLEEERKKNSQGGTNDSMQPLENDSPRQL